MRTLNHVPYRDRGDHVHHVHAPLERQRLRRHLERLQRLVRLQQLVRLQRLVRRQRLERLQRLVRLQLLVADVAARQVVELERRTSPSAPSSRDASTRCGARR